MSYECPAFRLHQQSFTCGYNKYINNLTFNEEVVFSVVNNNVSFNSVECNLSECKSIHSECNLSECKSIHSECKSIHSDSFNKRKSSLTISPKSIDKIKEDIIEFENTLADCVINTCFSKAVPIRIKKTEKGVKLESLYENCYIKVIDVISNNLNHNVTYPISYLLNLPSIESDPKVMNFSHDIIFNVYNYLQFLKMYGLKMMYKHLIVLAGADMDNAYWNGRYLVFGAGTLKHTPLTSSAIVGHELTHALIQQINNLEYKGHSGALNESLADIFGVCFEFYINEKFNTLGWEIGSECNFLLRNMKSPHVCQQPEIMYDLYYFNPNDFTDNGGVHINSGIINHIFYCVQEIIGYKKAFILFVSIMYDLLNNSNFYHFKKIYIDAVISMFSEVQNMSKIISIVNSHIY